MHIPDIFPAPVAMDMHLKSNSGTPLLCEFVDDRKTRLDHHQLVSITKVVPWWTQTAGLVVTLVERHSSNRFDEGVSMQLKQPQCPRLGDIVGPRHMVVYTLLR
jgi:hypothetical protein